jgi:hypothetical protein
MMRARNISTAKKRNDRGSALLVTLMVMVGLSLLGLGFVVISETENSISANERNHAQVLAVAESGARTVLEWFQDPNWAEDRGILPANANAIKTERVLTSAAPPPFTSYTGYYKSDAGTLLFDKPYKPHARNRFFGDEERADVIINATTDATFLAAINNYLFADLTNGQITDIRVYAPPILDGTLNANGFWESGTRYGLATIRVTAQKIINNQAVSERQVKLVISEWPFPGPQGPVQSNANISTGGNFGVHWGRMTSEGSLEIKRPLVGLPWFDAWNSIRFERGYFAAGFGAFYDPSDPTSDPNDATDFCSAENWLYKIYNALIEDPWYEARAKGNIINPISGTADQPFKFQNATNDIVNTPNVGWSNWFQNQDGDESGAACGAQNKKMVIFPKIDYEFWKALSQSASTSTSGVKYLRWVAGENYTDGIETKNFAKWVNTVTGAKPGFYFFDSRNGLNPQGDAPAGVLTPKVLINSSDDGPTFLMKGFIYLNSEEYGSQGINGPGGWYNFPGEPYRDIGYWRVNTSVTPHEYALDAGNRIVVGANNGEWNYQDVNGNGRFDVFVAPRSPAIPGSASSLSNEYFPVPWTPGCTPGMNGVAGADCSEPHEPYLNLVYPSVGNYAQACCGGGGAPRRVSVGWQAPNSFSKLPIKKNETTGLPITCTGGNAYDPNCTSNAFDRDGPLVNNFGNTSNTRPILDGVLYNEGRFDSQGNAAYFGSILINGAIIGTGTPEVWFDELLIKGGWQDKFKELPRVFVTAHETEQ